MKNAPVIRDRLRIAECFDLACLASLPWHETWRDNSRFSGVAFVIGKLADTPSWGYGALFAGSSFDGVTGGKAFAPRLACANCAVCTRGMGGRCRPGAGRCA